MVKDRLGLGRLHATIYLNLFGLWLAYARFRRFAILRFPSKSGFTLGTTDNAISRVEMVGELALKAAAWALDVHWMFLTSTGSKTDNPHAMMQEAPLQRTTGLGPGQCRRFKTLILDRQAIL